MSVIEHSGDQPRWRRPGMSAEDIAVWEAAERAAAAAPEIHPSDEAYMALRPLLQGWLSPALEERGAA